MHGGNIKAYNRGDGQKGTCMEINIPLGNAHLKPEEITTDNKDDSEEIASQGHKKNANKDFKILIVDDDHEIASYVMNELGSWYKFDYAANGREGLSKLLSSDFNLVISDVMMPEMDGITMLKKIKGNSKVSDIPVILLTSKSDIENRLEGLKRGADAFLAKPFSMEELLLRIEAILRRVKGKKMKDIPFYKLGNFLFDTQKQTLAIGDKVTKLTTKECELLSLLCAHANEILERNYALKTIWVDDNYFNARSMDVYITKLRKLLKDDPGIEIINIHGKGYKLITPEEE